MFKEENFNIIPDDRALKREQLAQREYAIMRGEIEPYDRNTKQLPLAYLLYIRQNPDVDINKVLKNEIMEYWIDEEFSSLFRKLEQTEMFGNDLEKILKMTLEDLIEYKKSQTLPE